MFVNKVILVGRLGRDPKTRYQGWGQRHSEPCAFVQFPVSYPLVVDPSVR